MSFGFLETQVQVVVEQPEETLLLYHPSEPK